MSLSLPPNFKSDIQGRDTALVPLVLIGSWVGSQWNDPNLIQISTNSIVQNDAIFKPLLLNIPSLKESIDIEKRNYKISSINLDISNFPYEGKRFSELIGDSSLINKEVRIWWTSPSCTSNPYAADLGAVDDASPFQIFTGTIRRYTHDDEKVRLVVEDRSQATLHKDLPLSGNYLTENNGYSNVPDKYKNKPIPMVYGHVDRSPCVISNFIDPDLDIEGQSSFVIKMDSKPLSATVLDDAHWGKASSFLYIDGGNSMFRITDNTELGYTNDQFQPNDIDLTDAEIIMTSIYAGNGNSLNSLADNLLEIELERFPKTASKSLVGNDSGLNNDESSLDNVHTPISDGINSDVNTRIEVDRHTVGRTYTPTSFAGTSLSFIFDNIGLDNEYTKSWLISGIIMSVYSGDAKLYTYVNLSTTPPSGNRIEILTGTSGNASYLDNYYNGLYNETTATRTQWDIDNNIYPGSDSILTDFYTQELNGWNQIDSQNNIDIYTLGHNTSGDYEISFDIFFTSLYQRALIENPLSQDFYANVWGRGYNFNVAPYTIGHIVENELGISDAASDGYAAFTNSGYNENNWKYAFTVDKKINSKKLIEGIASASPFIPRFNNMGVFKFDVIPEKGGTADHTIKEADVIDFSFSRTKIEDVHTKIEFKYNWDYARGEFNDSVIAEVGQYGGILEGYDFDYYGFENDHSESTLVIDDDRGKYIRSSPNHTTAQEFAAWYLMWSCNQHLKMKVKLPLKYMNLEIGDLVDFDEILGEVKPYGINYKGTGGSSITDDVNTQSVYKNFLITSTNKTLEWVEVECVQMHNLFPCDQDCFGECGDAVVDDCGVCDGDNSPLTGTCDCEGTPNGNAPNIGCGCGVGIGDPIPDSDNICEEDCAGILGGSTEEDICGVCNGTGYLFLDAPCTTDEDGCYVCSLTGTTYGPGCDVVEGDLILSQVACNFACSQYACDCDGNVDAGCGCGVPVYEEPSCDFLFFTGDDGCWHCPITHESYGIGCDHQIAPESAEASCNSDCTFNCCPDNQPDCLGVCGGDAEFDDCNVCDGDGTSCYDLNIQYIDILNIGDQETPLLLTNLVDGWLTTAGVAYPQIFMIIREIPSDDQIQSANITINNVVYPAAVIGEHVANKQTILWNIQNDDYSNAQIFNAMEVFETDEDGNLVDGSTYEHSYLFNLTDQNNVPYTIDRKITYTLVDCPNMGDLNVDGGFNVLDIVTLANCVLANNCGELPSACAGDLNGDGGWNVLDVVTLANCVLANNCGE